jgi:DNA-binding response OmpR family regulator
VLLVGDHEDSRGMYADKLRRDGLDVLEAVDAVDGLARAVERHPSIVVSDLRPRGARSTADLCRRFRLQGVPVIAVTAVGAGAEYEAIRAAGAAALLEKPLMPDKLLAKIRRVLSESPRA